MEKNKKSFYKEKNLFKLNNGYILEFNQREQPYFGENKLIFSAFFNEFDNHYILQTIRDSLYIRKDKGNDQIRPYIAGIKDKTLSKKVLFSCCLETLENLVKKDQIDEKKFDKKEKQINKTVQDYFYQNLNTWLDSPTFNEYIN